MNHLISILLILFCAVASAETSQEYISENAVELYENQFPEKVLELALSNRVLLLGEIHGTNEIPQLTVDLAKRLADFGPVLLGLEIPARLENQIRAYVETGNREHLKDDWFLKGVDGRASQAMVKLLRELRYTPNVQFFCFDVNPSENLDERDTIMAANVLRRMRENPEKYLVTLSGNVHSRLDIGFPGNADHKNMGSELLRLSDGELSLGNVTNIRFRFGGGTSWFCMNDRCGVHDLGPGAGAYSEATVFDRYFLREPELTDGHQATIYLRRTSASFREFEQP